MSAEHADERLWRAAGPGGGDMATVWEALAAGASVDVCRERGGLTFGVPDRVLLCRPKAWAKLLELLYDRGLPPTHRCVPWKPSWPTPADNRPSAGGSAAIFIAFTRAGTNA